MKALLFIPLVVIACAQHAYAQDTLPDGPGKEQVLRVCSTCHEAAKATSVKLTREGWIETIDRMKAFGAGGSDEEFAAVLEYLASHFGGNVEALMGKSDFDFQDKARAQEAYDDELNIMTTRNPKIDYIEKEVLTDGSLVSCT